MNLVKRAFGVPGYLYSHVVGNSDSSAQPLLEQARLTITQRIGVEMSQRRSRESWAVFDVHDWGFYGRLGS